MVENQYENTCYSHWENNDAIYCVMYFHKKIQSKFFANSLFIYFKIFASELSCVDLKRDTNDFLVI